MNASHMTLYGTHSPVRRWKAHVRASPGQITFVSPFVTSKTAERVLLAGEPSNVRLLTTFTALNFVHGSSSLSCLRKLVSAGCETFYLPGLHAKMMLVPGQAFTIGSQNLTNAGNRNVEMTIYVTDERLDSEVSRIVEDWVAKASPITLEMIDDMEQLVAPLRRGYLKLMSGVDELDQRVVEAEQVRREHVRTQAEREERNRQFADAVARATGYSTPKYARIEYVEGCDTLKKINADEDLLNWSWGGQQIQLTKTKRYLCVIPEHSKVGWVRVMKTRITKVGKGINWNQLLLLGDRSFRVEFNANWENASKTNVRVSLDKGDVTIDGFFSIEGFAVDAIIPKQGANPSTLANAAMLEANREHIGNQLAARLLEPFKFKHNLYGAEACEFFGQYYSSWKLTLGRHQKEWFLVASQQ